jgi:hypothetical protein
MQCALSMLCHHPCTIRTKIIFCLKIIIKLHPFFFFSTYISSFQENAGLVVPWIIGFITFMALEAVAMVYSNVLRDHVNRVSDNE